MSRLRAEIHAVVDVALSSSVDLWVPLPEPPRPSFVRLWGGASVDEVALVVGVLSSYGRGSDGPAASAGALLERFPSVAPGGLAVFSAERDVMPSCCCGLEHWSQWKTFAQTGQSPWTGHDPAPLLEAVGDQVHVWSDGGLGAKPIDEEPIVLSRFSFLRSLDQVAHDLETFSDELHRWFSAHAPRLADALTKRFKETFVRIA